MLKCVAQKKKNKTQINNTEAQNNNNEKNIWRTKNSEIINKKRSFRQIRNRRKKKSD